MKKQLLFLAFVAGIIVSNVEAMNVAVKQDPNEMLQDLKFQFKQQVFDTFNKLDDVLAANSNKKFDLYGNEWNLLTQNLKKYAGKGYVGGVTTMSTFATDIFNAIKDTYKDLVNAPVTSYQGQTVRSGNAYDFLDRVLFMVRLHNAKVK